MQRRSLRLDPAYWVDHRIGDCRRLWLVDVRGRSDPGCKSTKLAAASGAHFGYLQNILGYGNLSAGFWTLCIEVQFYLLFVAAMGLVRRTRKRASAKRIRCQERNAHATLAAVLAPASDGVTVRFSFGPPERQLVDPLLCTFYPGHALLVDARWPHFVAVVLGFSPGDGRAAGWVWNLDLAVALSTGLAIRTGRARRLDAWLGSASAAIPRPHFVQLVPGALSDQPHRHRHSVFHHG